MTDWTTVSALATGAGTLVLAIATFASVRSANRANRVLERSFRINLRPVLVPSRLEDPPQKVMFVDRHWVTVKGARAAAEVTDDNVYLAMQLRNVGNGIAVIEAWKPYPGHRTTDDWTDVVHFRRQSRDLWVAPGDVASGRGRCAIPMRRRTPPCAMPL